MKSVGYGEKSEMQDLNDILESCLGEMKQLEEDTAEFEKRIAEMEAGAEAEVKKATARVDRENQKLKSEHRQEYTALDHMKAEQTEKEREIDLLLAKRDSEAAKLADAEAETDQIERDIENSAQQIPDLRKQLAEKNKQNAALRKTLKSLEGTLQVTNGALVKKTADAEGLAKKVSGLKDRLGVIQGDGREAEQRHTFVVQRLKDILSGGPGDLDGEWQMLKDALREEHELELTTLTDEKTEKWRFELNKMDNEIAATDRRLNAAQARTHQVTQDLAAMEDHRDALLKELEALRLQLEEEARSEAYIPGSLDDLIKAYEELLVKKEAEAKRLRGANAQLEKAIQKLEEMLADLKEQVAEARLALAQEKVLYYKALENIENADGRKGAEAGEAEDALDKLKAAVKERVGTIKQLNEEITELRQLELDIAGLRAEIDKYSLLLDIVPDPKKKSSPARTASPSTQGNKRRRTETGTVAMVTPTVPAKKRAKAKKAPVVEEVEEEEEEEMEEDDDDEPMDLNDDGRITRSESRVYRAKKTPKGSKSTSKKAGKSKRG